MRRNERHADCQDGGRESTAARQDKRGLAVIPLAGGRLSSEFQQRPMHIEKRHELQYHGQVQQGNRSEEHTSELQSRSDLVCRLLLEKKKKIHNSCITSPLHLR